MTAEIVFTPDNTKNSEPTTSRNLHLVEPKDSISPLDGCQTEKLELEAELESIEHGFWHAVYAEKFAAHDTGDSFAVPRSSTDAYQAPFRRKQVILRRLEVIDELLSPREVADALGHTAIGDVVPITVASD